MQKQQKYKNIPVYYFGAETYIQKKQAGELCYISDNGRSLLETEKDRALYFSSLLELLTYKKLHAWVWNFKLNFPVYSTKLITQYPVILIPKNKCFPEFKHKVDFAIAIKHRTLDQPLNVFLIESKGIITQNSMLILRLIEGQYQAISQEKYVLVFGRYPDKFPRNFPDKILKTTPLNLSKLLDKLINPVKLHG